MTVNVPELRVAALGLALNAAWEFAHSPLYTDHYGRGLAYLLWTRVHCTVGDVLILLACFWLTALVWRTRQWWRRSVQPVVLFTAIGLAYTTASEWFHTTITRAWTYTEAMPRVFGIGVTPLLQWLILPPLLVWCMRWLEARSGVRRADRTGESG